MRSGETQAEDDANGLPAPGAFVPNYLLYLLAATSDAASAEFKAIVRHHNLRHPEWRVLACLYDEEGLMVTRLAELALMEQSRLTKIIDQMNLRGLVRRGSDVDDGRRVRVFLTPKGRDLATHLVTAAQRHEAQIFDYLLPGEGALLKALLHRLHCRFSAKPADAD
ncbi:MULTISPECIES: MarR family winged helix-turn-helix transcriptional regulator [Ensifer]|uniref:MarR family winged helix-turn-helix transcriptional regulator n=1 Tax=Ensifer TaxID=106591 RepID=UPI00046CC371|nr:MULTISPECIES: MarR family winged helix-turn-helix transcriptional regulator [Ensifer]KQY72517.1 hypothetical protein ASD52_29855 [Ensifer sp. Root142]MBD9489442.1 winged helix-turn-helix transcriptional regulator [Ensifer sp. ENS11]MDP9632723.1 DNA-binding MarR family transcriptional regulator [Ensifer adhaerens]NOV17756.1 MarR family transcriptional regulator [Ensifer canadensis]